MLNDKQIAGLCSGRDSMIVPFIGGQVNETGHQGSVISYGLSSFGYDIRVGEEFLISKTSTEGNIIDPKNAREEGYYKVLATSNLPCILPAGHYALAHSVETFKIPRDIKAVCMGKSTYARSGIIVNVTPLEPGWEGTLTIEISNSTTSPVYIYPNEGIAQLEFTRGHQPAVSYADRGGKYQAQTGITLAKMKES